MKVAVLDTTGAKGDVVAVVVNGKLVYAEDNDDDDICNVTYMATGVGQDIADALGVAMEHVHVPEEVAGKPVAAIVEWWNKKAQAAKKKGAKKG